MSADCLESRLDLGLAGWFRGVEEREGFRLAAALASFACNRSLTRERDELRGSSEGALGITRAGGSPAGFSLAAASSWALLRADASLFSAKILSRPDSRPATVAVAAESSEPHRDALGLFGGCDAIGA
jgi:hypothetical protein